MRIKICCIKSKHELTQALEEGIDCVGLVSSMPSGPGVISDDQISEIAGYAPPHVDTFLLTSLTDPHEIAAQWQKAGTTTVQLCYPMSSRAVSLLRQLAPGIKIVSVIHVDDESAIDRAREIERVSDGILLDSGRVGDYPPKLGGTGATHNWRISREIASRCSKPVWLAGGLNAGNVVQALNEVRPYGVDICSGVRTDDVLDIAKLKEFLKQVGFSPCF